MGGLLLRIVVGVHCGVFFVGGLRLGIILRGMVSFIVQSRFFGI
jgi:hypothetical protein